MRVWLFILICLMLFSVYITQAQEPACTLDPRLVVGEEGRVLPDIILNVRETPGLDGSNIGRLPAGGMFTVLDSAGCVNGYRWWQVDYHHARDQMVGWVAEGDGDADEYWLEPRGTRIITVDDDGGEHYFVELEDGATEPEGCLAPPEDYDRVTINGMEINRRTLFMLDHADYLFEAYGGLIDFRSALTQGSYTDLTEASFGTHDGGGAIDISVRSTVDWSVREDVEQMIEALRIAGFAAWLRETGLFYDNSPIHIHAIAIGDQEASEAAREQIDGDGGYLRGLDGLPAEYYGPNPDPHAGPIICQWYA